MWIEICSDCNHSFRLRPSPPSRWCGLKFRGAVFLALIAIVTTFAVVWIEIWYLIPYQSPYTSPPSRWCGLKFLTLPLPPRGSWAPPSRWCGLKYLSDLTHIQSCRVTTFAVVWIEITLGTVVGGIASVTTFAVVWIEIGIATAEHHSFVCHHLRGGVD